MNLNLEDWKKQKESDAKNICLDVRTAEEYMEGNIENSINIDFYKSMKTKIILFTADQVKEVMRLAKL